MPSPPRHSLEGSFYLSQLSHPGAQVGYSLRAAQTQSGGHALVLGADLGVYLWPRHDVGLFLLPRVSWRGRAAVGLQGEVSLHVGYLQGMLASENYTVSNGVVQGASRAGYPYLLVGPSAGLGWHFARAGVTPFFRAGALWQYPSFDFAMMRLTVAVGVEVALR